MAGSPTIVKGDGRNQTGDFPILRRPSQHLFFYFVLKSWFFHKIFSLNEFGEVGSKRNLTLSQFGTRRNEMRNLKKLKILKSQAELLIESLFGDKWSQHFCVDGPATSSFLVEVDGCRWLFNLIVPMSLETPRGLSYKPIWTRNLRPLNKIRL